MFTWPFQRGHDLRNFQTHWMGPSASRAMLAGNGDRRDIPNRTRLVRMASLIREKACAQGTWLTLDTLVNVDL